MEKTIKVSIRDRVAVAPKDAMYICGNSDFVIEFDLDDEWNVAETKTARFVYGGTFQDVIFTGNQCAVPVISDTYSFNVGVYAGDLQTTTPAYVSAKKSILCGGGVPADPMPDVYAQIIDMLNGKNRVYDATSTDGVAYAVDAPDLGELFYGMMIAIVPNMKNTKRFMHLSVNKSTYTYVLRTSYDVFWSVGDITPDKPLLIMFVPYRGGCWLCLNSPIWIQDLGSSGNSEGRIPITDASNGLKFKTHAQIHSEDVYTATATGSGGYTATIAGIKQLTVGTEVVIVPDKTSESTHTTFALNTFAAKEIRLSASSSKAAYIPHKADFLGAGKPVKLMYEGEYWKAVDIIRPVADALSGQVSIAKGGTGATTAEAARTNLSVPSLAQFNELVERVSALEG